MSFQEKLNMFNKKKEEDKKDITSKPEIKKFNKKIFEMFNQNSNTEKKDKNSNTINKIDKKVNTLEKKEKPNKNTNPSVPKKDRKQIILEKSSIISDKNPDLIIRKYPNLSSSPRHNKILLFIGDNQEAFINTIINMYSNIEYKDNYRYKVENTNLDEKLRTYNIASVADSKDIFIIAFPSFNRVEEIFNNEVMKSYIDLLKKNSITGIHYLFITVDKNNFLNKNELIYFLQFINLPFDENLKERIIILFPSDKENKQIDNNNNNNSIINDIFQDSKEYVLSEANLDFNFVFIPKYFYINYKIIYEKNNNSDEENEWKALSEVMKNLQNKISKSSNQTFNNNEISLINELIQGKNKSLTISNLPEIKKIEKKKDQIILLNYLIHSSIKIDISNIIIYLFQKIYKKIRLSKDMKEINFKDLKYPSINILALSKIEFNNLESSNLQNCDIEDQTINTIQNIFTPKLISLNLSENKLVNLSLFNKENIFINLTDLDLSKNNIEEIDSLKMGKFPNLKKLNLSHNKIINIKCLDNELKFDCLEELDLSYNNIKELNKINIPSLKFIFISNNPISEGIINFSELSFGADELVLEKNINNLNFIYSKFDNTNHKNIININFTYIIENNDINNILEKMNFKNINKLIIKGFENVDFLINDTLEALIELDLKNNDIKDISIFNNSKFNANLKELYFKDNINIFKGFDSMKKFNNIHIKTIYIKQEENKYIITVIYNSDNEINFIFNDLEFLKDELFIKSEKIDIEQSILDENINFFFEAIKNINSYPLFKRKPNALTINFNNEKYEINCLNDNYYSNLKMHFISDDLNIFNYEFFDSAIKIEFIDTIFDDNIDLSIKSVPNIKTIYLKNNFIKSIKIINILKDLKEDNIIIESDNSNKCDESLLEYLNEQISMSSINISKTDNNYCKINYSSPFNFTININKKRLNEIKSFKSCKTISLNKIELNDEDINFLKHESLLDLNTLILDDNKITNIEFLDKIKSDKLNSVSIKNNLIKNGMKYIEDNIKSEKLRDIKIKKNPDNKKVFEFHLEYNGNYQLYLDEFYDVNNNLDILNLLNLEKIYSLDLSNLNLKNIDFLSNKSLKNLNTLKLDNNQIEDLSIFTEVNFRNIEDLSIINNPIRKGLHFLKSEFFKKNKNIDINVSKKENEFKIYAEFKGHELKLELEFFINNIEDIKNIFDFTNSYVTLNTNNKAENNCDIYKKVSDLLNEIQKGNKPFIINSSSGEYEKEKIHIIIDNGSSYIKAGITGEGLPRGVFDTCVGYPKYSSGMIGGDKKEYFIGYDALSKMGVLKINYPIEKGVINNFDDMEKIFAHIFTNELRVAPEGFDVMIIESSINWKENREKIGQIMFEKFNVPCLYIANSAALSLYSAGRFTGLSIDSGESTNIVPIFEGCILPYATKKLNIGGKDLTEYLCKLLGETGLKFYTKQEKYIVQAIKEKTCYVALDFEDELHYVEPFDYELPDGNLVIIRDQRIKCPEALFKPYLLEKEESGLGQLCYDAIQCCDIDIRKDMYWSIVLSGGNSMFNGLPERLSKEIKALVPYSMKEEIKVITPYERKYASWIGGSILSGLSTFESCWITKDEYEEQGASIFHRKCF